MNQTKTLKLFSVLILLCVFITGCPEQSRDDGIITMRLGTDASGVDDASFNASAWRGILRFYGDSLENTALRGSSYDVITAETQDMYEPNLRTLSDGGYDLVIVTGFTWTEALDKVAADYPDQKYMIVDVDWAQNTNQNIMQAVYREHEGSFLVGIAAALKAMEDGIENPSFGFIGGVTGSTITKFQVGYIQGIRTLLPDAEIFDYYANSWGKPELAKAKAEQWYNEGVYAIYSAAGYTGNGTIQAAKESRLAGMNVWAIGVDSDQYQSGIYRDGESAILTSMIKKVDVSVEYALTRVQEGSFQADIIQFGLDNNGVGIPVENPNLSDEIISQVNEYASIVIKGDITLDATIADVTAPGHLGEGLTLSGVDD